MISINEKASKQYLDVSKEGLWILSLCVVCISFFVGLICYALVLTFTAFLISFSLGIIGGASFITYKFIHVLKIAQWIFTEQLSTVMDRVDAESESLKTHGIVQQLNTKGHAKVVVNNAPIINQSQEIVRIVPVHTPNKIVDNVSELDLADFINRIFVVGHSARALMGYRLPSGKVIDTFEAYDEYIQPLVKTGIIVGRGERRKGTLTSHSPEQAKEILGLTG